MRAPGPREPLHLRVVGQTLQLIKRLEALADTEVARRQHVGAVECKYKEHVDGPHADAFDLREMLDDSRTLHLVQRTVFYAAVREFLREVFDIRSLLAGEACCTYFLKRHRTHRIGSGKFALREEREETRMYRFRRRTRDLLMNYRAHERVKRILATCPEPRRRALQIRRPVFFNKRSEALVALEYHQRIFNIHCGEGEIRTPDAIADIRAFQARALDQLCDLSSLITN